MTAADDRAWVAATFDVSRETLARLDVYVALLARWSGAINLVARSTLDAVWRRHIADSAQLFALAPATARTWIDLGAGAGLPALVIAALAQGARRQMSLTAVESDTRKCAFMATAAREMGVAIDVRPARVEAVAGAFDVVSARAFAPLPVLLAHAARLLAVDGVALFPKGAQAEGELTAARERWTFDLRRHPSVTDRQASILAVREIVDGRS
ncbi:MAG: 16S rRNA (guanine(527)-N(7))-methyltransferase RsmG [Rhodobacteraceae bacterium]|nr:MAG: 16S rRNA (guanine(527)-N(7))-methyltransferase RsmG [Paracoccaceae bacterium]